VRGYLAITFIATGQRQHYQTITILLLKGRSTMSKLAINIATALFAGVVLSTAVAEERKMQMNHGPMMAGMDHCGMPTGEGVINALDVQKSKVNVTHEPIESLGWPEMKMDFTVLTPIDLTAFSAGERVHFLLKAETDKSHSIAAMCSLDIEKGAHEECMTHMHKTAMDASLGAGMACPMEDAKHEGSEPKSAGDAVDHSGHH